MYFFRYTIVETIERIIDFFKKNINKSRNNSEIGTDVLNQVKLFVLSGTHDKFTEDEFKHLKVCKEQRFDLMTKSSKIPN